MLRPVIVVGLGGSGGATVRFVMANLREQLRAAHWTGDLPRAFQFVHIDVPTVPDGRIDGIPQVAQAGGRYVGVAAPGAVYSQLDAGLVDHLGSKGLLSSLAGWRHKSPRDFLEIQFGAGQMRNVGREALSLRLADIGTQLQAAFAVASSPEARAELEEVSALFDTADSPSTPVPLVMLVSSIAGGSGASMLSDLAEVLKSVTSTTNAAAGRGQIAFVYTPETFSSIPAGQRGGIEPNALAAASELISAQLNSGPPTERESGLHISAGLLSPPVGARGPRVTFLIGASNATGAVIHGQREIYRSVGRTLAAVMSSPQLQGEIQNVIENVVNGTAGLSDPLGLKAGAPQAVNGFNALGFASVSLGRDRFAGYAAQRLAKQAVLHLLRGYWTEAVRENRVTAEQACDDRADRMSAQFFEAVGVPVVASGDRSTDSHMAVLERAWPVSDRLAAAAEARARLVDVVARGPENEQAGIWLAQLEQQYRGAEPEFSRAARARMRAHVSRWANQRQVALEHATLAVINEAGLPVAIRLLGRLDDHVRSAAGQLTLWQSAYPTVDPIDTIRASAGRLGSARLTRAQVRALVDQEESFEGLVQSWSFELFQTVAQLFDDFAVGVVRPLRQALTGSRAVLDQALTERAEDRHDQFASWPDAGPVSARFRPASVDVLVEDVTEFDRVYESRVRATFGELPDVDDAQRAARAEIVLDVGSEPAPVYPGEPQIVARARQDAGGAPVVLGRKSSWWTDVIPGDRLPSVGRYEPLLRPVDLLERGGEWVRGSDRSIGQYVGEDLGTYLRAQFSDEPERQKRVQAFRSAFASGLDFASPLVQVNNSLVQVFHGSDQSAQIIYAFSGVPLAGLPVVSDLLQLLRRPGIEPSSEDSFRSALTDATTDRIEIFGVYDKVMAPPVFASLCTPIAARRVANPAGFWANRRARALPWFIPLSPAGLDSAVRGWHLAVLLELVDISWDRFRGTRVSVWHEGDRMPVEFPQPLLTDPNPHGFKPGRDNRRDLLACLLESMPLAMALCSQAQSGAPLAPYSELIRLGESAGSLLENLISQGDTSGPATPLVSQGADPSDVKAAVLLRLTQAGESFRLLAEQYEVVDQHSLLTMPIGAEIAPEHVRALRALSTLAAAIETGDVNVGPTYS